MVALKNLGCSQWRPVVVTGVHPWIKHTLRQKDAIPMSRLSEMHHALSTWTSLTEKGHCEGSLWQCVELAMHVDGVTFLKGCWCRPIRGWRTGCQTSPTVGMGTVHLQRKLRIDMSLWGTLVNIIAESGFWRRVGRGHETQWKNQTRVLRGVFVVKLSQTGLNKG